MDEAWDVLRYIIYLGTVQLCFALPVDFVASYQGTTAESVAILVAVVVTACIVVVLVGCACCEKRNGFKVFHNNSVSASNICETGLSNDPGHVNPIASPEFTIFTPLSPSHHNNNVFRSSQPLNRCAPIEGNNSNIKNATSQVEDLNLSLWFDGSQNNFSRSKLKYIRELGTGWFGRAVEGEAYSIKNDERWTPVAVRILEASASAHEQSLFLHEAVMYKLDHTHPYILRLLGYSLEAAPLLLIQEFCPKGDLKKFLRENALDPCTPSLSDLLLKFCCQLASAVQYLHDNNIPHMDLAARNCQVSTEMVLKLGDYGLSVGRYPEDYYQGVPAIPVRWCAPETLNHTTTTLQPKQMTCEGNIWSLGITMWEICEFGAQPFSWLTDDEVVSQVLGPPHVRLPQPTLKSFYVPHLYHLMQLCWNSIEKRPVIQQIFGMLVHLLQVNQNNTARSPSKRQEFTSQDFDNRWRNLKPNKLTKSDDNKTTDVSSSSSVGGDPSKEKSASLTNLHGSFDNLLKNVDDANMDVQFDSWLQNVASLTDDIQYVEGLSQAIQALDSALASEQISSSDAETPKVEFQLGRNETLVGSSSETEDETWKKRIELGAYSEKVRMKSKSVTDLMVLTHIDCSDTDSETPLQSLEYRQAQYKNVRLGSKGMEASSVFGSEGNLLTVQDTFQQELRKLQEERRDSLLFVPARESNGDSTKEVCDSVDSQVKTDSGVVLKSEASSEDSDWNVNSVSILSDDCSNKERQRRTPDADVSASQQIPESQSGSLVKLDGEVHRNLVNSTHQFLLNEKSNDEPRHITNQPKVYNVFNVTVDHVVPKDLYTLSQDKSSSCDNSNKYSYNTMVGSPKNGFVKHKINGISNTAKFSPLKLSQIVLRNIAESNDISNATFVVESPRNPRKLSEIILQTVPELKDAAVLRSPPKLPKETVGTLVTSTPCVDKPQTDNGKQELERHVLSFVSEGDEHDVYPTVILGPCEDHMLGLYSGLKTTFGSYDDPNEDELLQFSSNFMPLANDTNKPRHDVGTDVDYSLETWDRFLGKSFDEQNADKTFVTETKEDDGDKVAPNKTFVKDEDYEKESNWEPGEGWFLHPQVSPDDMTGTLDVNADSGDSFDNSDFTLDEECVNALRNELAAKLPHAQRRTVEEEEEPFDWDSEERSEIVVKYNVYTMPLSPILEESCCDDACYEQAQNRETDSDSDWSEPGAGRASPLEDILLVDTENNTALILGSPSPPEPRHTPSQDSCCSNDTLFNLDDLNFGPVDNDHSDSNQDESPHHHATENTGPKREKEETPKEETVVEISVSVEDHSVTEIVELPAEPVETSRFELRLQPNALGVAPLPSPEDIPWRQLPASLLTYSQVAQEQFDVDDKEMNPETDLEVMADDLEDASCLNNDLYSNLTDIRFSGPGDMQLMSTSFSESNDFAGERDWDSGSDTRSSSSGEFIWKEGEHEESLRALHAASHDEGVTEDINPLDMIEEENSDSSNESDDGEDVEESEFVPSAWDAQATPTKSALRSPEKSNKCKKAPKVVWFKKQKYHCVYEYPREPESPMPQTAADLWTPYSHLPGYADWDVDTSCLSAQSAVDQDTYDRFLSYDYHQLRDGRLFDELHQRSDCPAGSNNVEDDFFISSSAKPFQSLSQVSQFFPGQDSARSDGLWKDYHPALCSRDCTDNVTPDSGVEDVTPASAEHSEQYANVPQGKVQSLKTLTAIAANKLKPNDSLGGLRHTRNKLKLDLPPSPSSFTSNKTFSMDLDPILNREVPTFTTFGKSRFLVQHVATPPEEEAPVGEPKSKNVSFEALPHKLMGDSNVKSPATADVDNKHNKAVEIVRGEASLLDSADEDSGIESSTNATLERQVFN